MTMQSNYFVTGEEIYSAQTLKEQVMNETDWAGAEITPYSFALFNALGSVDSVKNDHFLINDTIGTDRYFVATANVVAAAQGSSIEINIGSVSAQSNNQFRPGMGFVISGFTSTTYASRADVLVRIEAKGPGGGWICKTVWVKKGGGTPATTATTFDYDSTKGSTYFYIVDSEDLNGSAPMASSWYPSQRYNYTQLIRVPYGWENDMASQTNLFGNLKANTMKEAEAIAIGAAEHAMLFGQAAVKRGTADSSGVTSGALGSGGEETYTGGIPFLLGCSDLSATKTKYHGIDYDYSGFTSGFPTTEAAAKYAYRALRDFSDKMQATSEPLLGLTTKKMRSWIVEICGFFGYRSIPGRLSLPGLDVYYEEIDLGDIRIRMVCSDEMSGGRFPQVFDGSNFAYDQFAMFVLNPNHIGIRYREREEYGIMALRDLPLEQLRRELKYESEIMMEFGVGLEHRHKHGVFYLYGDD